jgi:fido (protein-threonine AMPylation protein)
VTFDPFGDFDRLGYLRNFPGFKDISKVKDIEHASFQGNIDRTINTLAAIDFIEYKHVLDIHRTLFGDVYPWAGQDRLTTAPDINISKGRYGVDESNEPPTLTKKEKILRATRKQREESKNQPPKKKRTDKDKGGR